MSNTGVSGRLGVAGLLLLTALACSRVDPPAGLASPAPAIPTQTAATATPRVSTTTASPGTLANLSLRPATGTAGEPASPPPTPQASATAQPGSPDQAHLLIPSLQVEADVITLPIVNGTWDLSVLGTQIGWLTTTGDRPGGPYAMAFVGHVTVSAAIRGPLADLWRTHVADEVIYRIGGTDYIYAIQSKYNAQPDDVKRLYVNDGQALLLVTCTDWNYLTRTYSERLMVRAELIRQQPAP